MATVTTALPQVPAPRSSRRAQRAAKEHRERSTQQSLDNWVKRNMKDITNTLCIKMYDDGPQSSYSDVKEFYAKYADYVINRERVTSPDDRVRLLALVLDHAKAVGRVVIRRRNLGSGITIELSSSEVSKQLKRAQDRQAAKEARRVASRRGKYPQWVTG